jgi:hypothetical protein
VQGIFRNLKKLCKFCVSARKMTFQDMDAAEPRCRIVGKLTPWRQAGTIQQ